MKKTYAILSVLLTAAISLCAQAPAGYVEKGALSESFSSGFDKEVEDEDWGTTTKVFATPYGWKYQKGTPSKEYNTSTSSAVKGKYIYCSHTFLQTDQTTPILLVTPMVKGTITFYIKPYGQSDYQITNYLKENKSWVTIYGGTPKATGGIDWNLTEPLFNEVFTAVPEGADANGWIQRNFSTTEYKFLGIQMSYAGFDELTAEGYCMPLSKVLRPTGITTDWSYNNPLYGDAEGNATWTGKVTVKNEGDGAIEANVEKLTVESKSTYAVTTTMTEFVIPEAIAAGEEKTFDLSVPVHAVTPDKDVNSAIMLTSNINTVGNTKLTTQSAWFTIKTMTPKLVVKNANKNDITEHETALGLKQAPASTTFTLSSTGGSTVVLKNITSTMGNLSFKVGEEDAVFPLEIARGDSKEITMIFGNAGGNSGTLTFTYGNTYNETTYTVESKTVSAIVADPSLYLEEFAATLPQGWINEEGSNWKCGTAGGTPANSYMENNTSDVKGKYLISPKLHFEAGQTLAVTVLARSSYSSNLTILTSTDRATWTEAKKVTSWTNTAGTFDAAKCELIVADMPVGDCYVAFEAGYVFIDYILGGTKVDVMDDIYSTVNGADNCMVNYQYALAIDLMNLTETAYEEGAIVLELKNGDNVVATHAQHAIAGLASGIKDTLRFTPHVAEEATLTLNVKKGETVLATLIKTVTIAEETVNSVVTTGEQLTTGQYVPLRTNYKNSKSEFIYTADKIGLKAGTQLTSITFNYYNASKEFTGNVKIWLQNTEDELVGTSFTDEAALTCVFAQDGYLFQVEGFSSACVDKTFAFSAPFVYQGGNLRVVICSEQQSTYANTGWGYESVSNSVIYKYKDNYDSYLKETPSVSNNLPIAKIGFAKEVPTISGEVILANGTKAGAGKKIEAKSGDVIYTTTTTAEGTYSVAIMQSGLTYDLYLDGVKVAEELVLNESTLVNNTLVVNIVEKSTGTGCEQALEGQENIRKMFINGHLYIQRGENLYDINGQLVK